MWRNFSAPQRSITNVRSSFDSLEGLQRGQFGWQRQFCNGDGYDIQMLNLSSSKSAHYLSRSCQAMVTLETGPAINLTLFPSVVSPALVTISWK